MMQLSDAPTMAWSKPVFEIPYTMRHLLAMCGYHEIEFEDVAKELLNKHGDWQTVYEEFF